MPILEVIAGVIATVHLCAQKLAFCSDTNIAFLTAAGVI